MRYFLEDMFSLRIRHEGLKQLLTFEIISFVALFGFAMGLLGYHRFLAAIVLFSVGCATLSIRALLAVFSVANFWKWLGILTIFLITGYGDKYLMGIVSQAEAEYYAPRISNDALASRLAAKTPSDKAEDLRRRQRLKMRTELGKQLTRNVEIRKSCIKDNHPTGFSCMNEYDNWNERTKKYISINMEPSYLPRYTGYRERTWNIKHLAVNGFKEKKAML